jgi:hypothetical protein
VELTARAARLADVGAITEIHSQGISDRVATFETELRTVPDIGIGEFSVYVRRDARGRDGPCGGPARARSDFSRWIEAMSACKSRAVRRRNVANWAWNIVKRRAARRR